MFMKKNNSVRLEDEVLKRASKIVSPENYYLGLRLAPEFELPANILCFFHDFPSPEVQHQRYCLVIAFDRFKYVINGKSVMLEPGMVMFHAPFCAHAISATASTCRRLQITFELNGKPGYVPENGISVMTGKMWRLVNSILKKFNAGDPFECAVELYRLFRELQGNSQREILLEGDILPKVRFFIQFNRHWRENIKSIASQMNMSESNLRLRFRKENGISLGSYLKAQKLELAKYRLQYTRQPLSEIGKICGYDSVFSFSRFFKNASGIAPLKYRQKFQNTEKSQPQF